MINKSTHLILCFCISFLWAGCSPKASNTNSDTSAKSTSKETESTRIWKDTNTKLTGKDCPEKVMPLAFRLLEVDTAMIKKQLVIQGKQPGLIADDTLLIEIPIPDGSWETFRISQVQVMAPELAAKYPYLKTYSGTSKLYPADQIRLEVSPDGVRAMILSTRGTILLDPFCKGDKLHMISFFKKNLPEGEKQDFEK